MSTLPKSNLTPNNPPVPQKWGIWWIKRDFRIHDNKPLTDLLCQSQEQGFQPVTVYLLDDSLIHHPETSTHHGRMISQALANLGIRLQVLSLPLLVFPESWESLLGLLTKTHIQVITILSHEETGTLESYQRDIACSQLFKDYQILWQEFPRNGVIRKLKSRDSRTKILKTRWSQPLIPKPLQPRVDLEKLKKTIPPTLQDFWINSSGLSDQWATYILEFFLASCANPWQDHWPQTQARQAILRAYPNAIKEIPSNTESPEDGTFEALEYYQNLGIIDRTTPLQHCSEDQAWHDAKDFFTQRGIKYSGGISSMNTAPQAASRFSVHLAWGTFSMNQAFKWYQKRYNQLDQENQSTDQTSQWRRSLRSFEKRLHWHDHFVQRLEDTEDLEFFPLNKAFEGLEYPEPKEIYRRLVAWLEGKTGYPYVDACIRCLRFSGYLNFRGRAMITSFAVHGLRLPWRIILYPMAQIMADYVPGIHLSQVQMQAGLTGINTLRVYSPSKQLIDQDPQCEFVRRWIPELTQRTPGEIHGLPDLELPPYPKPIIDFALESKIFKTQYFQIKKSSLAQKESTRVLEAHGSRKPLNKKKPRNR